MEIDRENPPPFKIGFPCDNSSDPRVGLPFRLIKSGALPDVFKMYNDEEGAPKFDLSINDDNPVRRRSSLYYEIKDWVDNEVPRYRVRDIDSSKAAVEYYNNKHGTDYEIVETLGSYVEMCSGCGLLYHCNFRAQRKSAINSGSGSCPPPELFFAEVLNRLNPQCVKLCVIMDKSVPCDLLPRGCNICPHLWHPVDFVMCSWLK